VEIVKPRIEDSTSEDEGNTTETGDDEGLLNSVKLSSFDDNKRRYRGRKRNGGGGDDDDTQILLRTGSEPKVSKSPPQKPKPDLKPEIRPIRVPIKVEPKTFFANERTLLQWLNAIVLLATVSIALIGLGNNPARISGVILLPIAIFFALYALVMYHFRRTSIRDHKPTSTYDDKFGPYAIVFVFVLATVASAVVPLVHNDAPPMDYNKAYYPFYPASLPFSPSEAVLTAPLPVTLFMNRTTGLASFRDYLNTLATSQRFYFDGLSTKEKLLSVTKYIAPDQQNISDYFSLTRIDDGVETDTIFKIYSNTPEFRTFLPPQKRPDFQGKDSYGLSMTCKDTQFYHSTVLYNIPKIDSFGDLVYYIN
jgi:uncharacterized membrane protein YidH (DUF202 family)